MNFEGPYSQYNEPNVYTAVSNQMFADEMRKAAMQPAEILQAPVAQAPTNKGWIDTLRGAMGNWGSTLTKGNVIPAIAQAGNIATTLSGAQNTPANAINKLAMNLAGGYGVGGNISPNKMAAPPMQTGNTSSTSAKPMPQSPQVKVNITGSLRDFNNDGVISKEEVARSQQPVTSNIKQMNTNFSPGGYSNLPGMLGQGPQSFKNDSGVSTGNPESVVNVPVSEATPNERTYALALLAGNPDVGVPGVMKYALDSGTQKINEQKAIAESIAANASMQKANIEGAKFLWEQSPAYIQRQGQIEYAKKMGDRKAELWLTRELQMEADKLEVTDPALRKIGDTYGDIMRKSGTTKIDGIISTVISAGARVTAANINAGATRDAASIMTADQIAKAINQENATLGQEKRAIMSDVRNREDSIMYAPSKEVKASIQAEIGRLKLRSAVIEERMNDNSLALKGLSSRATPQKTSTVSDNVYKSKEDVQAAIKKGKVKDGDSVTVDGKTFTVKIKGK